MESQKMKNSRFSANLKSHLTSLAVASVAACIFAGCGKQEIQTYRVAKEDNQSPTLPAGHKHAGAAAGERPSPPHVHSNVPEGWQELQADGMRVASYQIT